MIRIVLVNILLALLPALLYFLYVYAGRRNSPGEPILSNAPIFWLFSAGAALMLASMILFGHFEGGDPRKQYVPPRIQDGVVIPGHVE